MRSLARIDVFKKSLAAAVLTTLACWPRLRMAPEFQGALWPALAIMLWTAYFLWSFVFGWFEEYSGHPVFVRRFPARWWMVSTLIGIGSAWAAFKYIDPIARKLTPQDFPTTTDAWLAMTLFGLAFDQLFLCFAPVSFFERLIRRPRAALIGTVIFVMAVGALKIVSSPVPPPASMIVAIMTCRFFGSIISTVLFYHGGVVLVWWWVLVFQLRLLISLSP